MNDAFTHFDAGGEARMVDVGSKQPARRRAVARCEILMKPETLRLLRMGSVEKGHAFTVAKTAGILAAKKTSDFIPLCHPLPIEHVKISFLDRDEGDGVSILSEAAATAKTGVEMEALMGATIAALTLYDMAKGYDPAMVISRVRLMEKTGGKSDYPHSSRNHHSE